jgi:hypothetical protein
MANYIGALEKWNPYIQQIPTEAYTKVGMWKEQQYQAGVEKVQDAVDHIAGLDIANEGGRQYLRNRIDELTKNLNKFSQVDFSNQNNVSQLVGLAKPLYQDENIVTDVINTTIYRKWAKESSEAYKAGKMQTGQYARESAAASQWLNSDAAGSPYTGRQTPNTATKKDLLDRVLKAKRDGMELSEYVYDIGYDKDKPYYVKSTDKHYSEAEFNNFVANVVMSDNDREMLMNEHWFENQGVSTEELQKQDLGMYQQKISQNNDEIQSLTKKAAMLSGDDKIRTQKTIADLQRYNKDLLGGKIKFLQELNLEDPNSRDMFHRDLGETRYLQSLGVLTEEVKKEELTKNEQWFQDLESARKAKEGKAEKDKGEDETTEEVSFHIPVDPNAPKTELSLNTIQRGWQMKNDEINVAMNGLIGVLQKNGVDMGDFIAKNTNGSLAWDKVNLGGKAGATMSVPRFKDEESKKKFYDLAAGLNFVYTKEASDAHMDNKSFKDWLKQYVPQYKDDPNSKFNLSDKVVSDALNTIKGTSALLPKLEGIFADKAAVRALANIDEAIKNKKDMANVYREALLKSNALDSNEMKAVITSTDDDLLRGEPVYDETTESKFAAVAASALTYGGYSLPESAKSSKIVGSAVKGISAEHYRKADEFVRKTYSYVQEDLNTTASNLKKDEAAYNAVKDGLAVLLTRSRSQATAQDIQIDGVTDLRVLSGISDVEVRSFSLGNSEDIFNPNPMVEVSFKATVPDKEGDLKQTTLSGKVSMKSFLATNPNYRKAEYAKYFAPAVYAQKDAYARIKAAINPLEGSESSYSNRDNIEQVNSRINKQGKNEFNYDDPKGKNQYGAEYQWETIPIEKDGKQTMISYQVVSLGQDTDLGNTKNKDGQSYERGAFYVKMKVPTSNGGSQIIFYKTPEGESKAFSSASYAHYEIRDLIMNHPLMRLDDVDPNTKEINYLTTNPSTVRGFFNRQLSYNGFSSIETTKIKDALGKESEKQQIKANQMRFAN